MAGVDAFPRESEQMFTYSKENFPITSSCAFGVPSVDVVDLVGAGFG